ncbi:MAG: hypothetical protein D6B25_01990 [Desulfobulbaceae bacterium]|nr:MAG: hypothetical protein D6B25_01990 [Desulfobulbaceae bacterium]
MNPQAMSSDDDKNEPADSRNYYRIRFREDGQEFTGATKLTGLKKGDIVMVKTDHGLEPAIVFGISPDSNTEGVERKFSFDISRRPTSEEENRYTNLPGHETDAFGTCARLIEKHELIMRLVRVEKFFNGSKMIFYFTAENRVDFRALVKDLVQEFRTRVEMRQVGVRHETKMLGGLGTCGRELCCSSFLKKFDSVSIKMAKEQDLPLNPTKISGVCNRLLCCLTYEYDTYRKQRKKLPKIGRCLKLNEEILKVKRQSPLEQTIVVVNPDGEERQLSKPEWAKAELVKSDRPPKKGSKKQESRAEKKKSDNDTNSAE